MTRVCPSCGATMRPGEVICVGCGVDVERGRKLSTRIEPAEWSEQSFDIRFARGVGGAGRRMHLLSPGRLVIDPKDRIRIVGEAFSPSGCLSIAWLVTVVFLLYWLALYLWWLWASDQAVGDESSRRVETLYVPKDARGVFRDERCWISIEAEPGRWVSFVPWRRRRLREKQYAAMKAELARILGDRFGPA
jgi:hypothetical protein